ncbi:glutathione S-transferase family protein [Rhizobium sp. 2YAF20]|uniref:glutathione S-transferase family protein n=1 Tax=Rhizobium sp. 2YAF20 TaxID=3233027 RepID=UPI003F99490A
MNPKPEIFGFPQSNFARAVRIVCAEKAIDHDYHPSRPKTPEVSAIHPLGKIPVLRHGDLTIAESAAIVDYLDHAFPDTLMGRGKTAAETAEIQQWSSIIATSADPILVRKYIFAHLFPETADGAVDPRAVEAALPKMHELLAVLDARVGETGYLAAGRFTFADALLISTLAAVRLFPEGSAALAANLQLTRYMLQHADRSSVVSTDPWATGKAAE